MSDEGQGSPESATVLRRYLSFSRFVWLLKFKKLWLSRADQLPDEWEMALGNAEGLALVKQFEADDHASPKTRDEYWRELYDLIEEIRMSTFVSCWSKLNEESNALWRVYCPSGDGVAIDTTWAHLSESGGKVAVVQPVIYSGRRFRENPPPLEELAFHKRTEFEYEQEVRLVRKIERPDSHSLAYLGFWPQPSSFLPWEAERHIEAVIIDPRADDSFTESVRSVIEAFAPVLLPRMFSSGMSVRPMQRQLPPNPND
jgi:hypothetical protein